MEAKVGGETRRTDPQLWALAGGGRVPTQNAV